ncbi:Homocysteine S-methyltransferase [Symmachiella macrocystis]|uniref:S-methylmethionine:homocysteine methyltransferase n=1 Tax=Symmachiella macrocystis TaxID=2527985 RepID=A0A5C6BCK2_9PLAN|nr:homocysteine S-methyltransferase [Symmachiella macrocystis]TWU09337.1 Homocysteine S-methyltransferase [Symmachiella macrocystis]
MHRTIPEIIDRLDIDDPLLLDGALATEMQQRGYDISGPLWSARLLSDAPQAIRQLHLDYLRAGADCLITATYQATIPGLLEAGLNSQQAAERLDLAVRMAVEARQFFVGDPPRSSAQPVPLIAASIGPYGAYRHDGSEYTGDYGLSQTQLADFHRQRIHQFAASNADLLACETIPSLLEAQALVQVLAEVPGTPVWLSFSCRDEQHICHGERIADCGQLLDEVPQVVGIGVNCTAPQFVEPLIENLRTQTDKPIVVYPNSGETWDAGRRCWTGTASCDDFVRAAQRWRAAGARLIGGCCRTGPEHIRALATAFSR